MGLRSRLTKEQVQFAYRAYHGAVLAAENEFDSMRRAVGLIQPIDRILLVEDRAARELTKNLLRKLDHAMLLRSEVVDVGGAGEISRICQSFPRIVAFRIVGVYDGDSFAEANIAANQIAVFLPGDEAIERIFRSTIEDDPRRFAQVLGRAQEEIAIALASVRGLDHHDWFEELGRRLNIAYAETMRACFEQWIEDEYWRACSENFLIDLHRGTDA